MPKRAIFEMETIQPKEPFSSARVRAYVLNAMKKESKLIKQYLDMTTTNWLDKPNFEDKLLYGAPNETAVNKDPRIYVYPKGTTRAVKYWTLVNNGTRIRWVQFLPGYVPMTHYPGSFGNNRERTTLKPYYILDRSKPKPGIRARQWTKKLQQYRQPFFVKEIEEAIRKGLTPK